MHGVVNVQAYSLAIEPECVLFPIYDAYCPLHADARSDEGPPFEVLNNLPLPGIARLLAAAEGPADDSTAAPTAAEPRTQQRRASAILDSAIPEVPSCL